MIEADCQLPSRAQEVKPRRAYRKFDNPSSDPKERMRAYQKAYREKHQDYWRDWRAKPENVVKYGPKITAAQPCHNCGALKSKIPSGQWKCLACQNARNLRKLEWEKMMAGVQSRREQKTASKAQRNEAAAAIRAGRLAEKARREAERRFIAIRPSGLVDGVQFTERELSRFWSCVEKTETCWNWTGPMEGNSGLFSWAGGNDAKAHRVSFFLHFGPPGELLLERACRNTRCVRPDHIAEQDIEAIKAEAAAFRAAHKPITPSGNKPLPELTPEIIERFWSKVDKSGECWRWTGTTDDDGYGRFQIRQVNFPAHRIAFFLHNGYINDWLQVHHSCDSPFCVRGAHLSQGDNQRNILDSIERQRLLSEPFMRREILPTAAQSQEIRTLSANGVRDAVLSLKYGVSLDVIRGIRSGEYIAPCDMDGQLLLL